MYEYNVNILGERWTLKVATSEDLRAWALEEASLEYEEKLAFGRALSKQLAVAVPRVQLLAVPLTSEVNTMVEGARYAFAELMGRAIFTHGEDKPKLFYDSFKSQGRALFLLRTLGGGLLPGEAGAVGREGTAVRTLGTLIVGDTSPKRAFWLGAQKEVVCE